MQIDVNAAREFAEATLGRGTERLAHAHGAAEAARRAAHTSLDPAHHDLVIAAAWLHDVGFGHENPPTEFHPLDGALMLREAGWDERLVALVAHHSEARFTAAALGLLDELNEFPRETGSVADALVYADMSSATDGQPVTANLRLTDLRYRHSDEHPFLKVAYASREPYLMLATARAEIRMINNGATSSLIVPVSPQWQANMAHVQELMQRYPDRDAIDLEAALHTSASLAFRSHEVSAAEQLLHADALLQATSEAVESEATPAAG